MPGAIGDHLGAAGESGAEAFVPPGSDHFQPGREGGGGEFKAHLIVALAGGPMGDGVGPLGPRDLDHAFGDEGPGDAGAEKILSLVDRPRLQHGKNKIAGKLRAEVVDITFARAGFQGLFFDSVEFLFLSDIRAEGDDFGGIRILQPVQ